MRTRTFGSFITNAAAKILPVPELYNTFMLIKGVQDEYGAPSTIEIATYDSININPVIVFDSTGERISCIAGVISNIDLTIDSEREVFLIDGTHQLRTPVFVSIDEPVNPSEGNWWLNNTYIPPVLKEYHSAEWNDIVGIPPLGKVYVKAGVLSVENYMYSNRFMYPTPADKLEISRWTRGYTRNITETELTTTGVMLYDNYNNFGPENTNINRLYIISSDGFGMLRFTAGFGMVVDLPPDDSWVGGNTPEFVEGRTYQLIYSYGIWYTDIGTHM